MMLQKFYTAPSKIPVQRKNRHPIMQPMIWDQLSNLKTDVLFMLEIFSLEHFVCAICWVIVDVIVMRSYIRRGASVTRLSCDLLAPPDTTAGVFIVEKSLFCHHCESCESQISKQKTHLSKIEGLNSIDLSWFSQISTFINPIVCFGYLL